METLICERTLSELDHVRLSNLVRRSGGTPPPEFESLLDSATLVQPRNVSPDIVTMYSQVLLRDEATGGTRKLTLCYPQDAEPAAGFVSVFSPVGASLLGVRVGEVARWRSPDGDACSAEVCAILFQPEASGDYST